MHRSSQASIRHTRAMTGTSAYRDSRVGRVPYMPHSRSLRPRSIRISRQAPELLAQFLILGKYMPILGLIGWQTNDRTFDCVASLAGFWPKLACFAAPADKMSGASDLGRRMSAMIKGATQTSHDRNFSIQRLAFRSEPILLSLQGSGKPHWR